jgi:intracellular multiplication protein IcmV
VGVGSLKRTANQILDLAKNLSTIKKPTHHETFDEAVSRLELSEEDIQERIRSYRNMSRVYLCVFLFGLIYMGYLLINQYYVASVMMVSFSMLIFSFFFRESFWCTQLVQRRLGLSFSDWLNLKLGIK